MESRTTERVCVDELAAVVRGERVLEPAEVEAWQRHVVECEPCRYLLALTLHTRGTAQGETTEVLLSALRDWTSSLYVD